MRVSLPSLRQGIFDTPGLIIPSQACGMRHAACGMHVHTQTHLHTHTHTHTHTRTHAHTHMHMHMHTHMHTHVHMHVHMHYSSPRHATHHS